MPTARINRNNPDGTPKNCPDKTQQSFACTAVLDTFQKFLCSDEKFSNELHINDSCTAFMIKNDPGEPAVFATARHCLHSVTDCTDQSVVLKWRIVPTFPNGNPNVLEQHIYQCTSVLADGGNTSILSGSGDWAIFQVDREEIGRASCRERV